ncbi:MAG: M1 family metallopeptidase [Aureispira sp.]|nr:M1 family metallopeptidase [Aureispira sp.]
MNPNKKYSFWTAMLLVLTICTMVHCSAPESSKIRGENKPISQTELRSNDTIVPSCQHHKSSWLCAHELWENKAFAINSNKRCDTFDILDYAITLDMTKISDQYLSGSCTVQFKPKMNGVSSLNLDLLEMNVDSIVYKDSLLSYQYNDTILTIQFGAELTMGEKEVLTVYYSGYPQQDASWGGFYFDEGYAFNLGVGFDADPHNYGRVWYPCFDNFAERATYTFEITTSGNKKAHCNGVLISEDSTKNSLTRVWRMNDPIASYLACIAIADYVVVKDVYKGLKGDIPIELVALAKDTANLKQSFQHLSNAISAYEYWFGYHRWNKVGYSLVPFKSGAMEHATNITYPAFGVKNGSTRLERLMAHELAHSWWGNLVTCESSGDMWINEGMASYSESLFLENTYGWNSYIEDVKNNHYKTLKKAHISEGGYRPIAAVPHQYTYGAHVYDKGASVGHNLRWYMGDELFRKGLQFIIQNYQYKNINSAQFRDALIEATGLELRSFFNDWVFGAGFPHFEITRQQIETSENGYIVRLEILQKLLGSNRYFKDVPLEVTFLGANWEQYKTVLKVSGELSASIVELPFKPVSIILNKEHRLNQARYDHQLWCTHTGVKELKSVQMSIFTAKEVSDSAWLHLEYHPVMPTGNLKQENSLISNQRYWSVNGILPNNFEATMALHVQAEVDTVLYQTGGELNWILLYRASPQQPWQEHPSYIKIDLNKDVLFNFIVLKGDYAFGRGQRKLGHTPARKNSVVEIITQQEAKNLNIELKLKHSTKLKLAVFNLKGELLKSTELEKVKDGHSVSFDLEGLKVGTCFLKILDKKDNQLGMEKVYVD